MATTTSTPPSAVAEVTLGRHLRARRIAAGLSQVELAERANVSIGALRHLEAGAGANVTTLVKVVVALGAEDWLERLAPPPEPFSPMDVLARQRAAQAEAAKGPPRVRRARRGDRR
ncbi:MAG: helix-turn-helix domain-containing protein [Acidimicrobiia bacterium]